MHIVCNVRVHTASNTNHLFRLPFVAVVLVDNIVKSLFIPFLSSNHEINLSQILLNLAFGKSSEIIFS